LLKLTTVGATGAVHLGCRWVAIGDQTRQGALRRNQIADGLGNTSSKVVVVEGERPQQVEVSEEVWDGPRELVGVKLQEVKHGKRDAVNPGRGVRNDESVDVTSQRVVVQVQLRHTGEGEELDRERAGKGVEVEIQEDQIGQLPDLRRNAPRQAAAFHAPKDEVSQQAHLRWDCPDEIIVLEQHFRHAPDNIACNASPFALVGLPQETLLANEWGRCSARFVGVVCRACLPAIPIC